MNPTVLTAALILSASITCAQSGPPKNAYFGELHLHTAYSLDAYIIGNQLNDPFTAYRFAQGEEVMLSGGRTKQIQTALDFAAVTDHAEVLGELELCTNEDSPMFSSEICTGVRDNNMEPFQQIFAGVSKTPAVRLVGICGEDGSACVDAISGPWTRTQQAANEAYRPGEFTTFVAFEYSANTPNGGGGMMHRNVIFRSDQVPDTVFSAFDGTGEDLQEWLEGQCTGDCEVMTIPHNPNFYWGRLYWGKNSDGTPWTKEQVERRARMDRLVEVMQVKGSSECQIGIGTTDEECNFETVFKQCEGDDEVGCSNEFGFVRNGLKYGLALQEKWGTNPFKQGIISSTDNHNGTPSDTAEDDFQGHLGFTDADPEVRLGLKANPTSEAIGISADADPTKFYNPGGIAGVWAEENTRESIWDALHRRETFGTSGTRTRIRLLGGFDIDPDASGSNDWVSSGIDGAVPQGGDLPAIAHGSAPVFALAAMRDPASAPLARLQIIKGWFQDGEMHELTFDVACSDSAKPDPITHRCPDNGATVNLDDCTISQNFGAPVLAARWADPDFDAGESAFYYARVLENPVCRWSMYDAQAAGVEHPPELPKTIKERAWTSPIWYTPNG